MKEAVFGLNSVLAVIVLPMSRYEGLTVVSGKGDGMLVQ